MLASVHMRYFTTFPSRDGSSCKSAVDDNTNGMDNILLGMQKVLRSHEWALLSSIK